MILVDMVGKKLERTCGFDGSLLNLAKVQRDHVQVLLQRDLAMQNSTERTFVLPQQMRFGLVENGALEFTLALGLGGCLAIYRKSDIEKIVRSSIEQHMAKYQKFFTFSFLHSIRRHVIQSGEFLLSSLSDESRRY